MNLIRNPFMRIAGLVASLLGGGARNAMPVLPVTTEEPLGAPYSSRQAGKRVKIKRVERSLVRNRKQFMIAGQRVRSAFEWKA